MDKDISPARRRHLRSIQHAATCLQLQFVLHSRRQRKVVESHCCGDMLSALSDSTSLAACSGLFAPCSPRAAEPTVIANTVIRHQIVLLSNNAGTLPCWQYSM